MRKQDINLVGKTLIVVTGLLLKALTVMTMTMLTVQSITKTASFRCHLLREIPGSSA